MEYDPWQLDVLKAEGNILLNKGRQIGGTEIFAHKCAEYMVKNPDTQIVCVSLTLEQAENILNMVLAYLNKHHPKLIDRGKKKPTKTRVWLKNKAHTISRPIGANPGDAARSFTGHVLYVDEAGGMPRQFWVGALPILLTTAGVIWASSTPRGKYEGKGTQRCYYYECYLNLEDDWTVIEQTSEWVSNNRKVCETWTQRQKDGMIKFLAKRKKDMSKLEYGQEYLAEFMDENRQWFPDELIRDRMVATRPDTIDPNWIVSQGNDIAERGEDPGTYEIVRLRGEDHIIHIENEKSWDQPVTTTCQQIIGMDEKFNGDIIVVDDEGQIGRVLLSLLLADDRTKWKVHGISNSKRVYNIDGKERGIKKEELYVQLLSLMEKGKIDLLDDESVFQSFKSVQYGYETDSNGKRHLKIFGSDTHIVEGLTRACEILKYQHLNLKVYSIPV